MYVDAFTQNLFHSVCEISERLGGGLRRETDGETNALDKHAYVYVFVLDSTQDLPLAGIRLSCTQTMFYIVYCFRTQRRSGLNPFRPKSPFHKKTACQMCVEGFYMRRRLSSLDVPKGLQRIGQLHPFADDHRGDIVDNS
jgi:hypothetical protein